ncbi:MAG: GAF domain-containing protein [Candidatus Zixiibacteriota bacterium]
MNAAKLESLIEIAAMLATQSDFEKLLRLVTEQAHSVLKANVALIMIVNPLTRETIKTVHREGAEEDNRPYHLLHTYLSGWMIHHNSGFFSEDVQHDPRFSQSVFENLSLRSVMCAPLRAEG